jgi:hypothetical protein
VIKDPANPEVYTNNSNRHYEIELESQLPHSSEIQKNPTNFHIILVANPKAGSLKAKFFLDKYN